MDIQQTIQVVTETGLWADVAIGVGIFAALVTVLMAAIQLLGKKK